MSNTENLINEALIVHEYLTRAPLSASERKQSGVMRRFLLQLVNERYGTAQITSARYDTTHITSEMQRRTVEFYIALWFWCLSGFQRVNLAHKHAASLMCTHMPAESISEIPMAWECFLIDIPEGLISYERSNRERIQVTHVLLLQHAAQPEEGPALFIIGADKLEGGFCLEKQFDLRKLASLKTHPDDAQNRAFRMLVNFCLGVCFEVTEHRPASSRSNGSSSRPAIKRNSRGEPVANTFTLARNVKIDCREAVKEYVAKGSKSPLVQTLVRGHSKMQSHGVKKSLRKVIFVEPYWRGPEDAPIGIRSHILKEEESL